ncbi:MAG: hypothetical protein Hens3KO_22080 [Henriciella sp.]
MKEKCPTGEMDCLSDVGMSCNAGLNTCHIDGKVMARRGTGEFLSCDYVSVDIENRINFKINLEALTSETCE